MVIFLNCRSFSLIRVGGRGAASQLLFCSWSGRFLVAEKDFFVSESSASTASGVSVQLGILDCHWAGFSRWALPVRMGEEKAQRDPCRGQSPARSVGSIEQMCGSCQGGGMARGSRAERINDVEARNYG